MQQGKEDEAMGFRDLYGFNLAQCWRFSTDLDALVTRVFKAKYFPRRNFLEAQLGHNTPNYSWRSIWSSRVVLNNGYKWRIGDAGPIGIWCLSKVVKTGPFIEPVKALVQDSEVQPGSNRVIIK